MRKITIPTKLYKIPSEMFLNLIFGKCSIVNCMIRMMPKRGPNPIAVFLRVPRRQSRKVSVAASSAAAPDAEPDLETITMRATARIGPMDATPVRPKLES